MPKIVPIVEGPGDANSVPDLLRKILVGMNRHDIGISQPKIAHGLSNLTISGGVEKFIQYAWNEIGCTGVLILVDADKNCPVTMAKSLAERANTYGLKHPTAVVAAHRKYEAWFIASLSSIADNDWDGKTGLPAGLTYPGEMDATADFETFLAKTRPRGTKYEKPRDQPIFTRLIDIDLAKANSRSFRRLCHAVEEIVAAMDTQQKIITPTP